MALSEAELWAMFMAASLKEKADVAAAKADIALREFHSRFAIAEASTISKEWKARDVFVTRMQQHPVAPFDSGGIVNKD